MIFHVEILRNISMLTECYDLPQVLSGALTVYDFSEWNSLYYIRNNEQAYRL